MLRRTFKHKAVHVTTFCGKKRLRFKQITCRASFRSSAGDCCGCASWRSFCSRALHSRGRASRCSFRGGCGNSRGPAKSRNFCQTQTHFMSRIRVHHYVGRSTKFNCFTLTEFNCLKAQTLDVYEHVRLEIIVLLSLM